MPLDKALIWIRCVEHVSPRVLKNISFRRTFTHPLTCPKTLESPVPASTPVAMTKKKSFESARQDLNTGCQEALLGDEFFPKR